MTEDDARRVAVSLLNSLYPEFAAGEWMISGVDEYDTAWAFSYNSRAFLDAGEVTHALTGNGALVVPKSGDEPWLTWSGADTASQIARGRSAFDN
ncbi:YrhB domain-containing protein [Nocardioides okcheonensis]|uniref:YrhB domain-containing protein n=1 Tax=Nocardioides okcheonensis TaxID=2894081 RepID=UPI001E596FF8|nr:YrhB domain-containing protein [Nocardioides okcheonensis]UFN45697.1 YrhB family protein [Nocardioides okcheonensis]